MPLMNKKMTFNTKPVRVGRYVVMNPDANTMRGGEEKAV